MRFVPFLFLLTLNAVFGESIQLAILDYSNPRLKELRESVKTNLQAAKSSTKQFTELLYYSYQVKKTDSFFKIMAITGMDIDTLSSINKLSNPNDLEVGRVLEIPNMRGVLDTENLPNAESSRKKLGKKYNLPSEKFIYDSLHQEWFVPGAKLQRKEKQFFYGFAFSKPLKSGFLTSGYGMRKDPFTKKKMFHGGVDIAADEGTPVFATQDGVISHSGKKGGYGNLVTISHALGYESFYGHLKSISKKLGDSVKKGELIGTVGNTGRATGFHLHYELKRFQKNQKPIFQDVH